MYIYECMYVCAYIYMVHSLNIHIYICGATWTQKTWRKQHNEFILFLISKSNSKNNNDSNNPKPACEPCLPALHLFFSVSNQQQNADENEEEANNSHTKCQFNGCMYVRMCVCMYVCGNVIGTNVQWAQRKNKNKRMKKIKKKL